MSGARIIGTLINLLKQKDGTIACVSICNGSGDASAIVNLTRSSVWLCFIYLD